MAERTVHDFFLEHVLEPSDGCRHWPFAHGTTGYPQVMVGRRSRRVNILTCEAWHGPRPPGSPRMIVAAHSCGNSWCWAGEHLRWATAKENTADMLVHGTMPLGTQLPQAKLTEAQVLDIRARYAAGGVTQRQLGAEYGVNQWAISAIVRRHRWGWL